MGRTPPRHGSTLGRLRRYFQLPQWEVAGLLRITDATYAHLEAGRRAFPLRILGRLSVLLPLVPPSPPPNPAGYVPPPPPPPLGPLPPDAAGLADLRYRLKYCRVHAVRMRYEADLLAERGQAMAHRAVAVEALRVQAAQPDAPPEVAEVLARFAAIPVEQLTGDLLEWHRLQAAAAGLEAEAAALAAVLPPLPPPPPVLPA